MACRRRKKGVAPSNGYRRTQREESKLHKNAARQTRHDSRIWAKRVVDHHQRIAVEDFESKFLSTTRMARKAADGAIGAAKRELIERAGRQVVIVAPAYTTMTCSSCFARAKQRLGLAKQEFWCRDCSYTANRDRNAARTILAVAERGHTRVVDDVRHWYPSSGSDACAV